MPETRPIFTPDARVSLAYDSKDARWRVLVELDTGEAWAGEDRSLGSALHEAAAWIEEVRSTRASFAEALKNYPQRWVTGINII